MISHLKGTLSHKSPIHVVVDVNGVGYQVHVPLSTYYALPEPGGDVFLKIHTHVREDAFKLFGFLTDEEQMIFEKLISITKVGPKLALGILSGMPPEDLMNAVMAQDIAKIATIPGVGRKTAERLTLELKDKLADVAIEFAPSQGPSGEVGVLDDAVSALVNLGYKKPQAEKALKSIWEKNGKTTPLEDLIKESLNVLS
ncbi:MAG: Holliday junction ATP-dependent DNA helicase RuvA [Nitrospinaceae bacterium]|nr:MAG: Holliday junction ATP-dependent DNA helicase RuvA [Nitrospinaceae bacterium]